MKQNKCPNCGAQLRQYDGMTPTGGAVSRYECTECASAWGWGEQPAKITKDKPKDKPE